MAQKNIDSEIPSALLHRLPRYYRALRQLIAGDILRVRSTELARLLGTGASQIRQDLHYFGEFGQKGYGYNVKDLYSRMGELLGVNRNYSVAIWGENGSGIMLAGFPVLKQRGVCVRFVADSVAAPRDFAYPVIREEELVEALKTGVLFGVERDRYRGILRREGSAGGTPPHPGGAPSRRRVEPDRTCVFPVRRHGARAVPRRRFHGAVL